MKMLAKRVLVYYSDCFFPLHLLFKLTLKVNDIKDKIICVSYIPYIHAFVMPGVHVWTSAGKENAQATSRAQ